MAISRVFVFFFYWCALHIQGTLHYFYLATGVSAVPLTMLKLFSNDDNKGNNNVSNE